MRNDILYNRLKAMVGDVKVAREGSLSESYRLNCPFCNDSRHRLYINCKWGVFEPLEGHNNIGNIRCYNENCVNPDDSDPITAEERRERRKMLFAQVYRGMNMNIRLNSATRVENQNKGPIGWPGKVIRLDKLSAKRPDHPAVLYMQNRGFDPVQLGKKYGFVFCDQVDHPDPRCLLALGRILIPIFYKGEMRSWTGRYIGQDIPGARIKKYYNCPGHPYQSLGYNLDTALQYSTIVLVEGALDTIKTGPFAVGILSNKLNAILKKKIIRGLQKYGEEAAIVVMLDPEQNEEEARRGVKHHIEVTAAAFEEYVPTILKVYLPLGSDPASMSSNKIMSHIECEARKAKIRLNFERRNKL